MKRRLVGALVGIVTAASLLVSSPGTAQAAVQTRTATVVTQQRAIPALVAIIGRRIIKEVLKKAIDKFVNDIRDSVESYEFMRKELDAAWGEITGSDQKLIRYHLVMIDKSLDIDASGMKCDACDMDGNGRPGESDNEDDDSNGSQVDIDLSTADEAEVDEPNPDGTQVAGDYNNDGTLTFTTTSGKTKQYRLFIVHDGTVKIRTKERPGDRCNSPVPFPSDAFGVRTEGRWEKQQAGCSGLPHTVRFFPYGHNNPNYRDSGPKDPDPQPGPNTPGNGKIVRLVNELGWAVDVRGGRLDTGTNAIQAAKPQQGNRNQQWHLFDRGNGQYVIQTVLGGSMVLDVIPNNWNVQLYPAHYRSNQLWKFEPAGGGMYRIRAVYNMENGYPHGGCLTGNSGEGQGFTALDCNKSGQLWKLLG